jgi:hypothetical protein
MEEKGEAWKWTFEDTTQANGHEISVRVWAKEGCARRSAAWDRVEWGRRGTRHDTPNNFFASSDANSGSEQNGPENQYGDWANNKLHQFGCF